MNNLNNIDILLIALSAIVSVITIFFALLNFGVFKLKFSSLTEKITNTITHSENFIPDSNIELFKVNLEYELFKNYYSELLKKDKKLEKDASILVNELVIQLYNKAKTRKKIKFYIKDLSELKKTRIKIEDEDLSKNQLIILNSIISETPKLKIANSLSRFIRLYYSQGKDKELEELSRIILDKE